MEFKHLNEKNKTPKNSVVENVIHHHQTVNCDSPFRLLPTYSTPPSRFAKIRNPFESHLMERLHLPTFSPSVFAQASTPKNDAKFRWTIENVSNLKPADIDESTIDQHVSDHDPTVESIVQERIEQFFSEKIIVPSPMTHVEQRTPLLPILEEEKQLVDGSTQTVLTLPAKLPDHIEEVLRPYFSYTESQQQSEFNANSSLYHKLFEYDQQSTPNLSPALCSPSSPITLSPLNPLINTNDRSFGSPRSIPELGECELSPIGRKSPRHSRSACRLSFSGNMSIDGSAMIVPDIDVEQTPNMTYYSDVPQQTSVHEILSDSTVNWDMEYKHVSLISPNISDNSDSKMDTSNNSTPHSRIFTSQRKRLSDSFKGEEMQSDCTKEKESSPKENGTIRRAKSRLFKQDVVESGYHTSGATMFDDSVWREKSSLYASTPTKNKN